MEAMTQLVIDVTDETFEQVVVEGSRERPVVVDLWAAWCGPCRTLGPTLEKVATERDGAFTLAKIDVDAGGVGNALLQAVQSQSIPTVIAFRDGQPVSMFIGAYPEDEVNRFIDSILPSDAEVEAHEAEQAAAAGDLDAAEQGFRDALADDDGNRDAAIGLARLLLARGDVDEARPLVSKHLPDPDAERLHAQIEVSDWRGERGDGAVSVAKRSAAAGDTRAAFEGLVGALSTDRDDARQAMITLFAALGDDDPLVPEYRRQLAAALY